MVNAKTLQSAAFRCIVAFTLLFIITLPFPYQVLPDVGGWLSTYTEALVRWTGDNILHIRHPYTSAIVSDSTGMYIHALVVAIVAIAITAVWSTSRRLRGDNPRLRYLFHAVIAYYLSLQLLKYGLDKLFKQQFYLPEPNTLFTPIGNASRDILYWSVVGSSYFYTVCSGLAEVVPALLLLFRRTRIIGAIAATAVMAHVAAINFGFDISVKLYSCFLLLLCVIVAWPGLRRMFDLFIRGRRVEPHEYETGLDSEKKIRAYAIIKALAIGLVMFESLFAYFATGNFNDDRAPRPYLHGAYFVETYVRNGDTLAPIAGDSTRIERFFIHRRGYFITQSMAGQMKDYRLGYDITSRVLTLRKDSLPPISFDYAVSGNDSTLVLRGVMNGDSIAMRARRIDLENMPLLQRSFHWTIDEYR